MQKRPDAEYILSVIFKICIFGGIILLLLGFLTLGSIGIGILIVGVSLLISAIILAVFNRIHNVLLDIRDAVLEQNRMLGIIVSEMPKNKPTIVDTTQQEAEKMIEESESENPDQLDEWKDTQILKAKAAFDAGKISEEKYTSYVTKVLACKKIPQKK